MYTGRRSVIRYLHFLLIFTAICCYFSHFWFVRVYVLGKILNFFTSQQQAKLEQYQTQPGDRGGPYHFLHLQNYLMFDIPEH